MGRGAVVAQPVSHEKKNLGIHSEIRVAVVAQPVSTEKKKLGYTFGNHGCSGCSTGFNHSYISPKLYLRKSRLQWLLNRFQSKKKIGVYLRKSGLQWLLNRFQQKKIWVYLRKSGLQLLLNQFQPFLDLSQFFFSV